MNCAMQVYGNIPVIKDFFSTNEISNLQRPDKDFVDDTVDEERKNYALTCLCVDTMKLLKKSFENPKNNKLSLKMA